MQINKRKPLIVAFCCNWCSYAGADLAGNNRLNYPADVKIIRVPCSCRVNPMFVLRAFQRGADGVIICGEGVLVQGIIDVFWLEEDKIVLMDYKTDRVTAKEELLARYAVQLKLYGQALSRVFSKAGEPKKAAESLIYSFTLGSIISMEQEDEQR